MAEATPLVDIHSNGAKELIELTNSQFSFWGDSVSKITESGTKGGSLLHYWYVLTYLIIHGTNGKRVRKKDVYVVIPNLKEESGRKCVGEAQELGLVRTVSDKSGIFLEITNEGIEAVQNTLARWVREFGRIQREYFPDV